MEFEFFVFHLQLVCISFLLVLKKNEFNFLISLQDSKHSKLAYAWIILEI